MKKKQRNKAIKNVSSSIFRLPRSCSLLEVRGILQIVMPFFTVQLARGVTLFKISVQNGTNTYVQLQEGETARELAGRISIKLSKPVTVTDKGSLSLQFLVC